MNMKGNGCLCETMNMMFSYLFNHKESSFQTKTNTLWWR